jgi:YD repeat-containing protein
MNLDPGVYYIITVVSRNASGNISENASVTYSEDEIVPYKTAYIGGVRIKEIQDHDGINPANDIIRNYIYRRDYTIPLPAEAPAGYERSSLSLFTGSYPFISDYSYIDQCTEKMVVTSFQVDLYGIPIRSDGNHLGYNEVAEVSEGKLNGVKVTKFLNNGIPEYRGLVSDEFYYDRNMRLIKQINNKYSGYSFGLPVYHKIMKVIRANVICNSFSCVYDFEYYDPAPVSNNPGWLGLTKKTESIFGTTGSDSVESISNFYYNGAIQGKHTMLSQKIDTVSDGSVMKIKYNYPPDFTASSNVLNTMLDRHMISFPVEQQVWKDNKLVAAYFSKYKQFSPYVINNNEDYRLEINQPLSLSDFTGLNEYGELAQNTLYKKYLTSDYGSFGQLISQQKTDDLPFSYVWGYNYTLPVIKAENLNISNLNSLVGTATVNLDDLITNIGDMTTDAQKNQWRSFNTILRNNAPANALISTYTYKPLFGMTSQTDPNGITTYYEYDGLGRLKLIKDDNGNILKTYDYHYKQ